MEFMVLTVESIAVPFRFIGYFPLIIVQVFFQAHLSLTVFNVKIRQCPYKEYCLNIIICIIIAIIIIIIIFIGSTAFGGPWFYSECFYSFLFLACLLQFVSPNFLCLYPHYTAVSSLTF